MFTETTLKSLRARRKKKKGKTQIHLRSRRLVPAQWVSFKKSGTHETQATAADRQTDAHAQQRAHSTCTRRTHTSKLCDSVCVHTHTRVRVCMCVRDRGRMYKYICKPTLNFK